jgi:hypothetical protein
MAADSGEGWRGATGREEFFIIGDRESDVYGLLATPRPAGIELLVRSAQDRRLQEAEGFLHAALTRGPAAGQVLYAHHHHKLAGEQAPVPTLAQAVDWIAKLGGYWGRRGDAPPGVKVLWRGLQHLQGMVEGFRLASFLSQSEQRSG